MAELDARIDARLDALKGTDGEHVAFTLDAVDDAFLGLLDHSDVDLLGRRLAEAPPFPGVTHRSTARATARCLHLSAEPRFQRMVATLVHLGFFVRALRAHHLERVEASVPSNLGRSG